MGVEIPKAHPCDRLIGRADGMGNQGRGIGAQPMGDQALIERGKAFLSHKDRCGRLGIGQSGPIGIIGQYAANIGASEKLNPSCRQTAVPYNLHAGTDVATLAEILSEMHAKATTNALPFANQR